MPIILTPEQVPAINKFSGTLDRIEAQAQQFFQDNPSARTTLLRALIRSYTSARSRYAQATTSLQLTATHPRNRQLARRIRKQAHHQANIIVCAIGKRQYFSEILNLDPQSQSQACAQAFINVLDAAYSPDPRGQDHCACRQEQARGIADNVAILLGDLDPLLQSARDAAYS